MPTRNFNFTTAGTVRQTGATYPPAGSPFTSPILGGAERSRFAGPTYRIQLAIAKASISDIQPGAASFAYNLKLTIGAKNDADSRELRINDIGANQPFWSGITGADYTDTEFDGTLAIVNLSDLVVGVNTIPLSGLGAIYNGNLIIALGISGAEPTGENGFTVEAMTVDVVFSYSGTPAGLNIDGDFANGISIPRAVDHTFGYATGAAVTRSIIGYKRESDAWPGTEIDQMTSAQFWLAPGGTFTDAADDFWRWRVKTYNADGDLSAWSNEKTFRAVATLTTPTVNPSGLVSVALPQIVVTGMDTHTREQFYVLESGVVIYQTLLLVQTSGLHTLLPANFRNGQESLIDGHTYTLRAKIVDADEATATGESEITVLFTPPNQPVAILTDGGDHLNAYWDNPTGGATVDTVDIQVSTDYDPLTDIGTWRVPKEDARGLPPSGLTDDPNYQFYEARSGQLYWFRVRAWAGQAFLDSDPVNATLQLDAWLYLHDPDDPAGTILRFEGYASSGGSESSFARTWTPSKTIRTFLNAAEPSSDNEVTTAGVQVGIETIHVTVMTVEKSGFDPVGFKDTIEAMMKGSKRLCLRGGRDYPLGLFAFGQITGSGLPSRSSAFLGGVYVTSFEFTVTR